MKTPKNIIYTVGTEWRQSLLNYFHRKALTTTPLANISFAQGRKMMLLYGWADLVVVHPTCMYLLRLGVWGYALKSILVHSETNIIRINTTHIIDKHGGLQPPSPSPLLLTPVYHSRRVSMSSLARVENAVRTADEPVLSILTTLASNRVHNAISVMTFRTSLTQPMRMHHAQSQGHGDF